MLQPSGDYFGEGDQRDMAVTDADIMAMMQNSTLRGQAVTYLQKRLADWVEEHKPVKGGEYGYPIVISGLWLADSLLHVLQTHFRSYRWNVTCYVPHMPNTTFSLVQCKPNEIVEAALFETGSEMHQEYQSNPVHGNAFLLLDGMEILQEIREQ